MLGPSGGPAGSGGLFRREELLPGPSGHRHGAKIAPCVVRSSSCANRGFRFWKPSTEAEKG
jgi:hypothetical protein